MAISIYDMKVLVYEYWSAVLCSVGGEVILAVYSGLVTSWGSVAVDGPAASLFGGVYLSDAAGRPGSFRDTGARAGGFDFFVLGLLIFLTRKVPWCLAACSSIRPRLF